MSAACGATWVARGCSRMNRFEAVVAPVPRNSAGTHELRYVWNHRPFISRVFKRGAFGALLDSVMELQLELIGRGWRLAGPQAG